jgi:Dolichyl-phosphate-mannose-protein mannosyltransferase
MAAGNVEAASRQSGHGASPGSEAVSVAVAERHRPLAGADQVLTWARERWPLLGVVVVVLVAGAAARAFVLGSMLGDADFDEATVAVQAQQFTHGQLAVFFPNQHYGGTLEPGLVAVAFAVLGSTTFTLKLVPIALHLVATVLTWRIARRVVPSRAGQLCVPVLMWCGPAAAVLQSTKERGFYGVGLVLAVSAVLLVLRLAEEPSRRDLLLLGACAGLGWWSTALTVQVVLPAGLWLVARRPDIVRSCRPAALAALAGAAPWLAWSAVHGWASAQSPPTLGTTWSDRVGDWLDKLCVLVGSETPWDPDRRLLPWRLAIQALIVTAVVVATLRTRRRAPGLLAVLVVGYGVLYGLNGMAAGVGRDPRYLYLLTPILALCAGALVPDVGPIDPERRERRERRMVLAVTAAATSLTLWGLIGTWSVASSAGADKFLSSDGIGEVSDLLDRRRVSTAITDIAGMQISFLTDQRTIASSFAVPRVPAFERAARNDPTSTYVLDAEADGNARLLQDWLTSEGVPFERCDIGRWRVFFLAERVLPEQVGLRVVFGQPLGPQPVVRSAEATPPGAQPSVGARPKCQ